MTRRSGRGDDRRGDDNGGSNDSGCQQADAEAEAIAITTAIAGLRRRLKRPGSLDHPSVRRELRRLADELAELEDGKRRPGRHRSNVSRLPLQPAGQASRRDDAPDAGSKPGPASARTASEFIASLWQFRAWAGDPSWRKIAARSHHKAVHSTIYSAMHSQALPKLIVVKAIVLGCGGDGEVVKSYRNNKEARNQKRREMKW
jgi:hypothetical protein